MKVLVKELDIAPGYLIYSDGRIWSKKVSRFLKPYIDKNGYYRNTFHLLNKKKIFTGHHKIIALTFIPNPENKPQINHINGIKSDNRVENLEWVTNQENMDHSIKMGLRHWEKGDLSKNHKLNEIDIPEIRKRLENGETQLSIAKIYGVKRQTIGDIKLGRKWAWLK
jgi:HNH endonuclease